MPELPEVETAARQSAALLAQCVVVDIVAHRPDLRVPMVLPQQRQLHRRLTAWARRGKYLWLGFADGGLVIHLGMSGNLQAAASGTGALAHEHLSLITDGPFRLALTDPRRFGMACWYERFEHCPQVAALGPEPWDADAQQLYQRTHKHQRAIRDALLDGRLIAGIGNIYANEALFRAAIRPDTPCAQLSRRAWQRLLLEQCQVLDEALAAGGSTLKDYRHPDGQPGWFSTHHRVYGRSAQACLVCQKSIVHINLHQRSAFYCPSCQK